MITDERLQQLAYDPMMCNVTPDFLMCFRELIEARKQLAALQWRPITEQDVPKYRDEVGYCAGFEWEVKEVRCTYGYSHYVGRRWTHFRAINAPPADKAGA